MSSFAVCAAPASTTIAAEDLLNRSYYPSRADAANSSKRWYIIDAEGQTLGRLATLAATYIRCGHTAGSCSQSFAQTSHGRNNLRLNSSGSGSHAGVAGGAAAG